MPAEPVGQTLLSVPQDVPAQPGQQQTIVAVAHPGAPQQEGQARVPVLPDRATIARVVERVLSAQGIARGSGAPRLRPQRKELPSPSAVAAEIAGRLFGVPAKPKAEDSGRSFRQLAASRGGVRRSRAAKAAPPTTPAVTISPFVSENDVRRAMTRSEKIFVGPKTILTPSARDLGLEHEVFVETEAGSIR